MKSLQIVTGHHPQEMVSFAALELQRYVGELFGISATITPGITPEVAPEPVAGAALALLDAKAAGIDPLDDDQSFVLRRADVDGQPRMIAVGGSAKATMWAVYELVELWGVRYLLHGDVFPEIPTTGKQFSFPDIDRVWTPNLRVRCWRLNNVFACGPESWGLDETCRFINQVAKMKFNEILFSLWPWQPYLHLEYKGVKKQESYSWFNFKYPVDGDTIGKELFGGASLFENPDFAGITDYQQRHVAAKSQMRSIIQHGAKRGMVADTTNVIVEFPLEFKSILPGGVISHQLASRTCRPGSDTDPNDPVLIDLVRMNLRTITETYPDADFMHLCMPEHREWLDQTDDAWRTLDEKYNLSEILTLEQAIEQAKRRTDVHGGADRQVSRVKGDITMLAFLDKIFEDQTILQRAGRDPVRLIYSSLADELTPLLAKLGGEGSELLLFIDYTAHRITNRIDLLDNAPTDTMPCRFIFTLADDNIGLLPQLATKPLHTIATRMRETGWAGFTTRFWLIGDQDPCIHYLARSCWNDNVTPEDAFADLAANVCGEQAADAICQAWNIVEQITDQLDRHGMGFAFPVPGMVTKYFEAGEPIAPPIIEVRGQYEHAWRLVNDVLPNVRASGRTFAEYLAARLRFAVCYLDAVEAVCEAAIAQNQSRTEQAIDQMENALTAIREGLEIFAAVVMDNSDRGAIAIMNDYAYRPIRDILAALKTGNPTDPIMQTSV